MEWIKVTDRLPERDMRVLVTAQVEEPTQRYVEECYFHENVEVFTVWDSYYQEDQIMDSVIAWTPFPEPYDGD